MAYEYVNIRTDTIDNVKVPTKETLDARTIIESTLEPSTGTAALEHYNIGIWQFPKTGFYKIKLSQLGTNITFLHLYARKTKDDGTLPEDDFSNDNLVMTSSAGGDGQLEYIYILADYLDTDSLTAYKIQFLNPILRQGITWVNTYDKTTQKWSFISAANVNAKKVSNTLTLTKGDTTTVYDGSVAREVSIPTKTSELTNDSFVSYAEQTLTEGQQNQAKTNLGIDVLTGNTTDITPTQVKEAILAGRPVAITYTDTTYGNATFTSFGYSLEENVVVANVVVVLYGQYILASLTGRINTNKWVTLQTTELGTSTDIANNYVKYSKSQTLTDEQKAQARTNIGANFEPFKVTLSRTYGKPYLDKTPKEIYDAYTAGKYVYLEGNSLLPLTFAKNSGDGKYTISFSGTSKVSENYNIQVTSFSVINVTPDYSEQWTENYKYNIDAKVFELNYNPSTNEVSGSNPYNSIATLNYSGSGQTAVIQLNVNNANNKLYLNQIITVDNNTFIFQVFGDGNKMLTLIITSNSMQIQASPIINENNVKNIVDQSYVAFYTEQALSDKEKKQARDNIDAISSSELVQSDWNQNDETAKDYIKNRICYTKDATETIVLNSTLPFTDISSSGLTVFRYQDTSSNIKFNEGTTYTVNFDTTSYTCIAFTDDRLSNAVILGNLGITGMSSATNEPFAIITDNKGNNGLQIVTNLTGTSHNVKIAESHTEIVKLDKKYIPDDIFINIENIDNKVEDFINNAQFLAKTDSVGTGSFSFNRETGSTVGENSATFGLNNIASGKYAFAEGSINKATNFASHAEGNSTTASGNVSHAEGLGTKATGATSHSEGLDTVASGDYSHAEGEGTTAEGKWSHTEGKSTNTKGWASHAEGSETVAQGICSHAEGRFTVALGENQHVEGILNIEDTTSLHIVGNGTYTESSGQKTKSNAHTLDKLGNAWFAGNVYVGSTSGTNKDDGSKKLATEEYVNNKTTTITVEDTLSDTSTNPVQNKVINTALKDKLQYKGNWQSNTTYNKNDVVYDETNMMYVYTETDATSDPPDINPNCQPIVNIATNVKKGTLGIPNASTIYSQFNYLIDASTTDSGKYLTVNSEGNPEWGTITAPEESVVIAKLTGAGTTASPYACDKTYNELYTAILAGKYVLMYDNTTKRMLSPYFINIQARLLQFQHVLYEQTGFTTTTSKLTAITVNYKGSSNTLTRTVYSSNIVSSVNGKTENVITLSASDVGAASSEDLNTLKNSIPEITLVTLDD